MVTIVIAIVTFAAAFFLGERFGSAVIPDIKAELAKVDATASADVKALAAKIKAIL